MSRTILIIDDDLVSQFALRYTIQQCDTDCEVFVCDGAQEGLDLLSDMLGSGKDLPDIILLDLDMPDLDGWAFLDRYHKVNAHLIRTKIFIVSAFSSSPERNRAKHHAMVEGSYDKPLSRNDVVRILGPVLDQGIKAKTCRLGDSRPKKGLDFNTRSWNSENDR